MSEPVSIISTDFISFPEFMEFLKKEHALHYEGSAFEGRVSEGTQHVWIALSSEGLAEDMETIGPALLKRLVRQPKSHITLEISSTQGSEHLAVDFAIKVLSRWHGVLCDFNDQLLDLDELRQMKAQGRGFTPVRMRD